MTSHTVILLNPTDLQEIENLCSFFTITTENPEKAAEAAQKIAAGNTNHVFKPDEFKIIAVFHDKPDLELSCDDYY